MVWDTYEDVAQRVLASGRLRPDQVKQVLAIVDRMAGGVIPGKADRDLLCDLDAMCKRPIVCKHRNGPDCTYKGKLEYYRRVGQTACGLVVSGRYDQCEFYVEGKSDGEDIEDVRGARHRG